MHTLQVQLIVHAMNTPLVHVPEFTYDCGQFFVVVRFSRDMSKKGVEISRSKATEGDNEKLKAHTRLRSTTNKPRRI